MTDDRRSKARRGRAAPGASGDGAADGGPVAAERRRARMALAARAQDADDLALLIEMLGLNPGSDGKP